MADDLAAARLPDPIAPLAHHDLAGAVAGDPGESLVFIINSLTMGGAERVFATLVNRSAIVRRERLSVLLLDADPEVRRIEGVPVTRLDGRGSLARSVRDVVAHVRRTRPSVVVAFLSRANVAAIAAVRLLGGTVVISERVDTTAHFAAGSFSAARRALTRMAYPRADRIVAVSAGVADTLVRDFAVPRRRTAVVHNPVDIAAIGEQAALAPEFPVDRTDLVAIGRLMPNKNFALAIDAWRASGWPGRLIVLGEGPLREALAARASAHGIADRLKLAGFVSNPHAILARAGGFVLSSNAEGFPNALVEAMACGVPAVATDCRSGPAEILRAASVAGRVTQGEGGLIVPVDDVAAMAEAIQRLQDPATAETLVAAARRRVADFSVDHFVARFWEEIDAARSHGT